MLARTDERTLTGHPEGWDGIGLLYRLDYCRAAECFYCPSHQGHHEVVEYDWFSPAPNLIYTNYHYGGHADWDTGARRRLEGANLVLAVDGLPFGAGFNHDMGMNTLRGDGSVIWDEESRKEMSLLLAQHRDKGEMGGVRWVWRLLEERNRSRDR